MSQEMGLIEKDTEENTRFDDVKETEEKEEEMSQEMGLIEKDTEENTRFDDVKETEEKEEEMSQEMGLIEKDTEENTRFDEETEEKEEEMSQEMGVIEKDTEENTGFDEETEEEEEEHRKRMEVIVNIIENSMEDGKEDHEEEEEDIDQRLRDEYDNSWEDPSYQPGKDEGGGSSDEEGDGEEEQEEENRERGKKAEKDGKEGEEGRETEKKINKQIVLAANRKRKAAPRKSKKVETKRPRRECPFKGCGASVTELTKHFRQVHPGKKVTKVRKYSRARRVCPRCAVVTTRMDLHLVKSHGFSRGLKEFEEAMAQATLYEVNADTNPNSLEEALNEFCDDTRDRAGGLRIKAATAAAHRSAVRQFMKILTTEQIKNLDIIGRPDGEVDKLLEKKTHKPATLQLYLGYLAKFVAFLGTTQKWHEFLQIAPDELAQLSRRLKNVAESLEADASEEAMLTNTANQEINIEENKRQIGQCIQARGKVLKALLDKDKLSINDKCNVRDILIVSLTLLNFKRAGDVPHIKLADFLQTQLTEDGRDIEVDASTHKLAKRGIRSHILIPQEYHQQITKFINKCRGEETDSCPFLFTTLRAQKGQPRLRKLEATVITKIHAAEWKRAALVNGSGMTATMARKVAASLIREMGADRDDQAVLAKQMVHRLETADQYYDKASRSEKRREVVDRLRESYKEGIQKKDTEEEEEHIEN